MVESKISVITPVLNGADTVRTCIESVRRQDYPEIEHLFIDGCSTDGTVDILKAEGVTYISQKDTGIYDALNKGVILASGTTIHILNVDDYYAYRSVVRDVVSLMQETDCELCHGYIEQVDGNGTGLKRVGRNQSKRELFAKMRIAHPSVFVRKDVYDRFGLFNTGFRVAGDHEFLLRIWDRVSICFLPKVLVKMRIGGASNSQVEVSYRESMAAALLHGASPWGAACRFYWELFKNKILMPLLQRPEK